jgi:hypothetical protein
VRRLVLAGVALALFVATARPAFAQGDLYGIIESPAINGTASEPFQIRGWAFWTTAASGAGVDAINVYGCPIANCPTPVFWGAATIGLARPDVAATYGNPAGATSGYSFTMSGLTPTVYYVQVWVHVIATGAWQPFNTSFTVTATPEHVLEHPVALQSLAQPLTVSGWAIDAGMPSGTGVDAVHVWAYHNFGNGTPSYMLGAATYGDARPDVAAARGSRFLSSGYHFTMTGQPPGWYRFVVSSHSWPSAAWTGRTVDAYVDIPTASLEINRSGTGTGSIVGTGLSCPGVDDAGDAVRRELCVGDGSLDHGGARSRLDVCGLGRGLSGAAGDVRRDAERRPVHVRVFHEDAGHGRDDVLSHGRDWLGARAERSDGRDGDPARLPAVWRGHAAAGRRPAALCGQRARPRIGPDELRGALLSEHLGALYAGRSRARRGGTARSATVESVRVREE